MNPGRIISALVGIVGALWLGIAGGGLVWWWDRRPAHTPEFHAWLFHWSPPNSLQAQLDRYKLADAASKARAVRITGQAAAAAQTADVAHRAAVERIRTVTQTLVREVPVYVSAKADALCVVPVGFVSLYDAAADGRALSDPSGAPAVLGGPAANSDTPSGVKLSGVLATDVENLGKLREAAEQVRALQALYERERALQAQQ